MIEKMVFFRKIFWVFIFALNSIQCLPSPEVKHIYIGDIHVPGQVSSSAGSFDITLIENNTDIDCHADDIQYESTITPTSLDLTVKGYHHPASDGSFGCNGAVVYFGTRIYTVIANPLFSAGNFIVTVQNPGGHEMGDLQKTVTILP